MELFVSYRHDNESNTVVSALETACNAHNLRLRRDVQELGYRDSIEGFMAQLAAGNAVIVVLSDGYFKSQNCMRELLGLSESQKLESPIFPIVIRGCSLLDNWDEVDVIKYWEQEAKQYEKKSQKAWTLQAISGGNLVASTC